jgi:quinol-cytochrome oxidoreductase complex cytochrome b subunit
MSEKSRNFFDHLHAGQVRLRVLQPFTTCGFGIAALTCLGTLFVTGFTLFLYYVPDHAQAYERILHISTTLRYGRLIRNLHYLSANALLILALLHLSRIFLMGSYKLRRLNWIYGLVLLLLVLFANFTGYLLPWDQISYWAVKVGASLAGYFPIIGATLQTFLLGGLQVGPETLVRSFALHVGILPFLLLLFTSLHLWRIRKDGGLALPEQTIQDHVAAAPWLYRLEAAVAMLVLATLIVLALVMDAPIFERADPAHPPNPAKAPWYFVGFQELVSYSALVGGIVVPVVLAAFLLFAPFLDRSRSDTGQWFAADRWRWNLAYSLLLFSQVILIIIGLFLRGPNWQLVLPF